MERDDIVLGFDTLDDYIENKEFNFNCILGRVAGVLNVDKKKSEFAGLSKVNWIASVDGVTLVLSYLSPKGDEGYASNLLATVKYQITEDNRFIVTYNAAVDTKVPVDLSHRLYFNLAGHSAGPIEMLKHVFHMNCDMVMKEKPGIRCASSSKFVDVGSTNYDLRVPQLIILALSKFDDEDSSLFSVNSYDEKSKKKFVCQFIHRQSGRAMEIYSDKKCVIFSPCNNLPGAIQITKNRFERFLERFHCNFLQSTVFNFSAAQPYSKNERIKHELNEPAIVIPRKLLAKF